MIFPNVPVGGIALVILPRPRHIRPPEPEAVGTWPRVGTNDSPARGTREGREAGLLVPRALPGKRVRLMRRWAFWRNKWALAALAGGTALGVVLWLKWTPILAWYYVRALAGAGEDDCEHWVRRVASLEEAAVPRVVDLLRREDARACVNARAALAFLVRRWGPQDPRSARLAERLANSFATRSLPGQLQVVELQADLLLPGGSQASPPANLVLAAGRVLNAATRSPHKELNARALALADIMVDQAPPPELLATIYDLTRAGLMSPDTTNRTRAVHLARSRALAGKKDLVDLVLPLLRDPCAPVRCEALQAVALKKYPDSDKYLISGDDLLAWLHDPDKDVRRWCARALRARGLSELDIEMARLITDDRAKEKLKVVLYLDRADYQTPGAWIARLCDDREPAVKIAAIRAAAEHHQSGLADRIREMAQTDPSPTVRQVAESYLKTMQAAGPVTAAGSAHN
jgi:hypothetical protein